MAYDSPLFQSSLELFSHSIEHFNCGTEKDRKFVILHLANSIELIFKDLLLDLGESIYKNPKETITITSAIETLTKAKNITISHLNKLELLIDERNSLQHRYGFPNELTTIFYMDATFNFFKDFLKENYALEIDTVLKDFISEAELETFMLRKVSTQNELDKLVKLAKVHPVGALLSAYAYFEKMLYEIKEVIINNITPEEKYVNRIAIMRVWHPDYLPRVMSQYGVELEEGTRRKLFELRSLRNSAAHGRDLLDQNKAVEFIKFIKELEPKIKELKEKVNEDPRLLLGQSEADENSG